MSEAVAIDQNVEPNQQDNQNAATEPTTSKPIVPICQHLKDDGIRCGTPAVNGRQFCYYHHRAHHPGARIASRRYRAPVPESVASLQIALAHTLQALATGELTPKQANSMMYGINLGTNLLRLFKPLSDAEQQQVATEIPEAMEQVLVQPEPESAPQPENQTSKTPEHLTNAVQITEHEIERLRFKLLPPEEFTKYQERVRTLGRTDPDYYTAVNRICDHDSSLTKLQEMGVL
jgi:hypothetical protein